MGVGQSSQVHSEHDHADLEKPVYSATLNTDGKIEHRDVFHDDYDSNEKKKRLEVQAAAHWHRIIQNTRDIKVLESNKLIPKCEECVRGRYSGPNCLTCGRPFDQESDDESNPKVKWNPVTKSYERLNDQRTVSSTSSPLPSIGKQTLSINPSQDLGAVVDVLLSSKSPEKGVTGHRRSSVSKITAMGARARLKELEEQKEREEKEKDRKEKERAEIALQLGGMSREERRDFLLSHGRKRPEGMKGKGGVGGKERRASFSSFKPYLMSQQRSKGEIQDRERERDSCDSDPNENEEQGEGDGEESEEDVKVSLGTRNDRSNPSQSSSSLSESSPSLKPPLLMALPLSLLPSLPLPPTSQPTLPGVSILLRSRSASSLSLAWDQEALMDRLILSLQKADRERCDNGRKEIFPALTSSTHSSLPRYALQIRRVLDRDLREKRLGKREGEFKWKFTRFKSVVPISSDSESSSPPSITSPKKSEEKTVGFIEGIDEEREKQEREKKRLEREAGEEGGEIDPERQRQLEEEEREDILWGRKIHYKKYTRSREVEVRGLLPNSPYALRCRRQGWDGWGPLVVIRTGPGPPSAPLNLHVKEASSSSLLIHWSPPERDNGLPVLEYRVFGKQYGADQNFQELGRGKERVFLATKLSPNSVNVFEISAINRAGESGRSERLASRTLPKGAPEQTPWVEAIDPSSDRLYYSHPKTGAVSWTLPKGAILDEQGSFRFKTYYIKSKIHERASLAREERGLAKEFTLPLTVNRNNLLEESLQKLFAADAGQLDAGHLKIRFEGEEGLDAGGLAKDWFASVSRSLMEGTTGLLSLLPTGEVTIDPRAVSLLKPSEARWLFRALGIFIAKALIDDQTLGLPLAQPLLLQLAGKAHSLTLEHLGKVEPEYLRGLTFVMENDVMDMDLTFSTTQESLGEQSVVELKEFGLSRPVLEENKTEYVDLMVDWLLSKRYQPCLENLLSGFHRHIPIQDLAHFRLEELQWLLSGQPHIEVTDIRRDCEFQGGFSEASPQIQWLWSILEEMDQKSLSRFLSFVTACPAMPVEGLKPPLLITLTNPTPIESDPIHPIEPTKVINNTLPRAHTCFNQLVLPAYSEKDILKEKLLFALENAGEAFLMS